MTKARDLAAPAVFAAFMVSIAYTLLGRTPAIVFAVAFGGGLVLYMATAWRRPFDPRAVIIPYLLTIMAFVIHTFEEYLTHFEQLVSKLAGRDIEQASVLFIIAWLAPFIWVGGAVMLMKRWAFGYYFLCAFFFAMTIAELAHFVFPFLIDGTFHYESGMYTAALPLIPAWFGLYRVLREIARERAAV